MISDEELRERLAATNPPPDDDICEDCLEECPCDQVEEGCSCKVHVACQSGCVCCCDCTPIGQAAAEEDSEEDIEENAEEGCACCEDDDCEECSSCNHCFCCCRCLV